MAVRHRLIKADPAAVWEVLADGNRYADWVVGTGDSWPREGQWPQLGASIEYEIRLGPMRLTNRTIVRHCEEGTRLELEIMAGYLGTARFSIELREWGEYCLVIADEHPLQGAGAVLHNVGVEALIQMRHRSMLARLARLCEDVAQRRPAASARQARTGEAPGHA
ncbi:SRPBCC family protein [Streptomyces dangxiongensis]|uniref:SRPBCC family protein n=1 Tax=Streptomyces dangxiongensis TaxID=1442032 RepID=A0A3G2JBK9_9ACTN|nr:SRPBCC family protein [Streptomyces dangxiongensis]AYN37902.1 SRPBCC family protein [Streptomyces dangxiongensis]